MTQKDALRKQMKKELKSLPSEKRQAWEAAIFSRLFKEPEWLAAKTIGVTASMPFEINTVPIMEEAWRTDKTVALPKCDPRTRQLDFRIVNHFNQLEVVYYGLQEPVIAKTEGVDNRSLDLLIVPGLLFTTQRYRLGFGGGYYDRLLSSFPNHTIALAFDIQVKQMIPVESHDVPVHKLLTHTKVYAHDC